MSSMSNEEIEKKYSDLTVKAAIKRAYDDMAMKNEAMRGISRAKHGSVRRLVEAGKNAVDGLCDPERSEPDVARLLVAFNAALADIELEQENDK